MTRRHDVEVSKSTAIARLYSLFFNVSILYTASATCLRATIERQQRQQLVVHVRSDDAESAQ